jgi:hypothetical protein
MVHLHNYEKNLKAFKIMKQNATRASLELGNPFDLPRSWLSPFPLVSARFHPRNDASFIFFSHFISYLPSHVSLGRRARHDSSRTLLFPISSRAVPSSVAVA